MGVFDGVVTKTDGAMVEIQKQVGAAVFFERMAIPHQRASVSLRVMLDAAQEAGVLFTPVDPENHDMELPPELIPLADKAIAQGKAVRLGWKSPAFTEKERRLIGKYTHCSATWNIESDRGLWVDPNKPNDRWVRSVWYRDDQQQVHDNTVKNGTLIMSDD